MLKSPSKKSAQQQNHSSFTLSKTVGSPLKLRVMTSMPDSEFLLKLEKLQEQIKTRITSCFSLIYSHVVQRNAAGEGQAHFFIHGAATALYEDHHQVLIKGKDHGKKAASIFNHIKKTLSMIEHQLANNAPKKSLLRRCQAVLIAHFNAYALALNNLTEDKKDFLKKYQNIDEPAALPITPKKKKRIQRVHPNSPKDITPKKLSRDDLQAIAVLSGIPFNIDKPPVVRPLEFPVAKPVQMVPRQLLLKHNIEKAKTAAVSPAQQSSLKDRSRLSAIKNK
ncbi:MAG: hypothetical protein AB7V32_04685 [Candidatus Berkiella sp.]